MRYVDGDEIHNALDYAGLIEALRAIYLVGVDFVDRFAFEEPLEGGKQNSWILLPAWQYGKYQGIKLVSVFPNNSAKGQSFSTGHLFFGGRLERGAHCTCFDGDVALTVRRTACNSALASTYLSRQDSSVLLMVGAGNLAPHMISAHCAARAIKKVLVWNRSPEAAKELVARMLDAPEGKNLSVMMEVVDDLEAACKEADIISCATMTSQPLIMGAWLNPGCHLDLVGGYRPNMRESDDHAVRRAQVFVDTRISTLADCGDICQPIASGLLNESDITDLFQLVRGERAGRQSDDQITLFKSGGGGHEDLGTAQYLISKLGHK